MIYHEIAVDPDSFEDFKDLGLLEKMFGFEHGRLIPFMPSKGNDWHSQVKQRLTDLYPEKSKEIELRLVQIMDRCVWRSRGATKYDPKASWRSLAVREHSTREFAAILCGEEGICCPPEYSYQGLHSPPDEYPDFLRKPIHVAESLKSPDVFLENLRPLITSGNRITLIDAYLNPLPEDDDQTSLWLKTLKKLATFLGESKRKTIDVDIHTKSPGYDATKPLSRENIKTEDFLNQSIALIEGWFPKQTTLSLTSWSERYQGQRFHARYIITNKAGVALDYGLDMRSGQRTDVSLLPLDKAKQRLGEFDWENPSLFKLDGRKSFNGTR
jgi:hypothetical protein